MTPEGASFVLGTITGSLVMAGAAWFMRRVDEEWEADRWRRARRLAAQRHQSGLGAIVPLRVVGQQQGGPGQPPGEAG